LPASDSLSSLAFDPGLDVRPRSSDLSFEYGPGVFGPPSELRKLDDIRKSLRDPMCDGPDPAYGIAMDVGKLSHRSELTRRSLLFGLVAYAPGLLGREPVRSQGHIHAVAPHCGWSTPELFEVWEGCAIIYAQQSVGDHPGKCLAVKAGPGDQVVMPPGWAHYVINAGITTRLVFSALCEREYGFIYDGVRARGGLAWYPLVNGQKIEWEANPHYALSTLELHQPRPYPELGLDAAIPIYKQFELNPDRVQWVSEPGQLEAIWPDFEP